MFPSFFYIYSFKKEFLFRKCKKKFTNYNECNKKNFLWYKNFKQLMLFRNDFYN